RRTGTDSGPLRRAGSARGGRGARPASRRGGRGAYRHCVAVLLRRVRTGFRLSGIPGRAAHRRAARGTAYPDSGGFGGTGRRLFGRVSPGKPGRLAAHRPYRSGHVGYRTRPARGDPGRRSRPVRRCGGRPMIVIEEVGPPATVQDLGRPGWFDSGVGPAGAADRGALRLANRLVGNPEHTAGIEVLLGGLVLRAEKPALVAVTGAPAPATVDGTPVGHACVLYLDAG